MSRILNARTLLAISKHIDTHNIETIIEKTTARARTYGLPIHKIVYYNTRLYPVYRVETNLYLTRYVTNAIIIGKSLQMTHLILLLKRQNKPIYINYI